MGEGNAGYGAGPKERRDHRNATRRRWYKNRDDTLTTPTEDIAAYLAALRTLATEHQARRRAAGTAAGPTIGSP